MSNISGEIIPRGEGARLRIRYDAPSRPDVKADLTEAEAEKIAAQVNAEPVSPRK